MRLLLLAVLGFLFVTTPVLAAQQQDKHVFGSYTCKRKQLPCDRRGLSSEQWAAAGADCLRSSFGYHAADEVFDEMAGLDESDCLTLNTSEPSDKEEESPAQQQSGARIAPHCCNVHLYDNVCAMQCQLVQE